MYGHPYGHAYGGHRYPRRRNPAVPTFTPDALIAMSRQAGLHDLADMMEYSPEYAAAAAEAVNGAVAGAVAEWEAERAAHVPAPAAVFTDRDGWLGLAEAAARADLRGAGVPAGQVEALREALIAAFEREASAA